MLIDKTKSDNVGHLLVVNVLFFILMLAFTLVSSQYLLSLCATALTVIGVHKSRRKKYTSGPRYWNVLVLVNTGTCKCYSKAYNTGTQKWSSIVQYSCTSTWDLKYTFSISPSWVRPRLSKFMHLNGMTAQFQRPRPTV